MEMWRLRRLDAEGHVSPEPGRPLEHGLDLGGAERLAGLGPADRDQEEQRPQHGAEALDLAGEHGKISDGPAAHGRVDLQRQSQRPRPLHDLQRVMVRPPDTAESVVGLGGGAIEADRQAGEPGLA
jgi:hypothetical protein